MKHEDAILAKHMRKARVLVVDIDPDNRQSLLSLLQPHCEVMGVDSEQAAFEACRDARPDLILVDTLLDTGGLGLAFGTRVRNDDWLEDIPLIYVTNHTQAASEDECWDAGAVDVLVKPISERTIVNRVRSHLMLKLQRDFLRQIAYLDGLTGIYNRRYFDEQYGLYWRQCKRSEEPLSLLIIDIDWFKQYNDSLGHLTGDDALRLVAGVIRARLNRPLDFAARYGGEEFAVVLPGTGAEGARGLAERIVATIYQRNLPHPSADSGRLTVSVGVACCSPGTELETEAALLHRADCALYEVKRSGRNGVSLAQA